MKKILLFLAVASLGSTTAFSQNIEIIKPGGNHSINDSLIHVNGTVAQTQFLTSFDIINTGASSSTLNAKWDDSTMVPSTTQQLCWGLCYGAQEINEWQAPKSQTINAHDTNFTFVGYYNDSGKVGCEIVRYVFFDLSGDSAWVFVEYCISPLAVQQISANALHISAPYPNPAGNYASFNYHINSSAQLNIYNSIGQSVKQMPLNPSESKLNLNVSSLPSGVYICKLEASGASPVFQKLVVTH